MAEESFFSKQQEAGKAFDEMEKLIAKSKSVKRNSIEKLTTSQILEPEKKMHYIFKLSSDVKIEKKERQIQLRKEPEFALNIVVTVFDLQFERRQIQQAVHLGEFFSYYNVFKSKIR